MIKTDNYWEYDCQDNEFIIEYKRQKIPISGRIKFRPGPIPVKPDILLILQMPGDNSYWCFVLEKEHTIEQVIDQLKQQIHEQTIKLYEPGGTKYLQSKQIIDKKSINP